ncbi:uncharacterized protein [Henckelia pumila]|uniref:uncharacterized protein n=1 Tax=Henckelia pumila TaxID=405737 RepID=UPI003C6DD01D
MANSEWLSMYRTAEVLNLEAATSDHSAILLKFELMAFHRRKCFRFENAWISEPDCKEVVKNGWKDHDADNIQKKIEWCGKDLQMWGDTLKLKFKKEIHICREQIKYLKSSRTYGVDQQIREVKKRIEVLLAREELYWKQRSKVFWLKSGDANTKLFHHFASSRKRKNSIVYLQDDTGHVYSWDGGLQEHISNYFQNLFSSKGCLDHHILHHVPRRIDNNQNQLLIKPFDECEVVAALKSMHPDKSPGPDGMNPGFYQHFWDITEGFSALLQSEVNHGTLHGVKVARKAPAISHLFFADDCFLFFRASLEECTCIKDCLNKYELASGQIVNFNKSSISFSSNVPSDLKNSICETLGVGYTTNHGNYLGLPSLIGHKSQKFLRLLKKKLAVE